MIDSTITVQRIATKALIVNEQGHILILREATAYEEGTNIGRYNLPGGRLEMGEPYEDGLKREVAEETGLDIEIGRPFFVGEWHPVIKGIPTQIIAIFFVCKASTTNITLSQDHDHFAWMDPDMMHTFDLMDPEDKVVAAYIELERGKV